MIVSLNVEQTQKLFLYIAKQMIIHKPLLDELDPHCNTRNYGMEIELGFIAVRKKLSAQQPLHINDIFKTCGVAILTSMGGFAGAILGTVFLGGVKGLPIMNEMSITELSMILENALQILKSRGGITRSDQIIIDAFERAVAAFAHSVREGDTLFQALYVAEFGAQESMEKWCRKEVRLELAKPLREKAVIFQDPGATCVWLLFKSMREWVASLENSTW